MKAREEQHMWAWSGIITGALVGFEDRLIPCDQGEERGEPGIEN